MSTNRVVVDDRLLIARLLDHELTLPRRTELFTTGYMYYRACRAAIAGGAGHLSGPFRALPPDEQAHAIQALLMLPDDFGLPDTRILVPRMAGVSRRYPRLNLLNVEMTAAALTLDARVLLSPPASRGVLPDTLAAEGVTWDTVVVP